MNKTQFITQFSLANKPEHEPDYPLKKPARPAAVLIPLLNYGDELRVLLTRRALHLRHHPGQISFPGGAYDATDDSLADTALREAFEEVGLPQKNVEIIGEMPAYRTISGYAMTPFVGIVDPNYQPVIDYNEVADTFTVPLAYLLDQQNHHIEVFYRHNTELKLFFIDYQGEVIWGATAAILRNLSYYFTGNVTP